jgi:uncharacterized protein DUF4339
MLAAPRERWFLAEGLKRTGPLDFEQLIQLLLDEADPRAPLVWRKGFGSWTRAEDVPRVERRLTPGLARAAAAPAIAGSGSGAQAPVQTTRIDGGKPGSPVLVYGSVGAGVMALALLGWLFWPRSGAQETPPAIVLRIPTPTPSAPVAAPSPRVTPAAPPFPAPAASGRPATAFADREADLPASEVRRLRGVAAWSGETLALTVENRTAWRVTELRVKVSRLSGDDLVQDAAPLVLLPPAPALAPDVVELLNRVAPDRKRPGLYPDDTGPFEAEAGPPPDGFRWEIESARGYAPSSEARRELAGGGVRRVPREQAIEHP